MDKKYNKEEVVPMLLWFRCNNCYSFAEDSGISLEASAQRDNNDFVTKIGDRRILRVASIYGANASGKSNLFSALSSVFYNVIGRQRALRGESFIFDAELENNSIECEIAFLLKIPRVSNQGAKEKYFEFKYGYNIKKSNESNEYQVVNEWLVKKPSNSKGKYQDVFSREGIKVKFGTDVSNAVTALEATVQKGENILFLSMAGKTTEEPFSSIYDWCTSAIPPTGFEEEAKEYYISFVANTIKTNDNYKQHFLKFLKKFDPCIVDVHTSETKDSNGRYDIVVKHSKINTSRNADFKDLNLSGESQGTQKITGIYPLLMYALDIGGLAMVDELDTKLHPLILREIIKMFHDTTVWNKNNAQLIFSAHNTVALNSQDMRRDEIHFVKKDSFGRSTVERLSGVETDVGSVRSDLDFGKNYLAGRFGAIPDNFVL